MSRSDVDRDRMTMPEVHDAERRTEKCVALIMNQEQMPWPATYKDPSCARGLEGTGEEAKAQGKLVERRVIGER